MSKTTIILADDNSAILAHVSKMFDGRKEFEVLAAISDEFTVVSECLRLRADIIVLDISMGELSGIDIARQLRDLGSSAKIIFLTIHEDSDYVNAAIGAGGSGYVVKSRLSHDLFTAADAVLCNKFFVSRKFNEDARIGVAKPPATGMADTKQLSKVAVGIRKSVG